MPTPIPSTVDYWAGHKPISFDGTNTNFKGTANDQNGGCGNDDLYIVGNCKIQPWGTCPGGKPFYHIIPPQVQFAPGHAPQFEAADFADPNSLMSKFDALVP